MPLLGAALTLVLARRPRPSARSAWPCSRDPGGRGRSLLALAHRDGPLRRCTSAAGPPPVGIVLVADELAALMLVVSAASSLCVLLYSIAQGLADGDVGTPVAIYHPTYLVLAAGVTNAFLAGDLFNLFVGFEILLAASYRAAHPRRHRGADPGRRHVHRGQPAVVADLPARSR